jgi:hypothetical protein
MKVPLILYTGRVCESVVEATKVTVEAVTEPIEAMRESI